MTPEVFICHSEEDNDSADKVCAALEAEGIKCWIAPRDVRGGAVWAEAITEALDATKVMVIVISSNTIGSQQQVIREIELADARHTVLLPVFIENVTLSKGLEYYLTNRQWNKAFPPPLEQHLPRVVRDVREILTGAVQPTLPRPPLPQEKPRPAQMWPPRWLLITAAAVLILALVTIAYNSFLRGGRGDDGPTPTPTPVVTPTHGVTPIPGSHNNNGAVAGPSVTVTPPVTRRLPAPQTVEPKCRTRIQWATETLQFKWSPVEGASSYTVEWDCFGCASVHGWSSQSGRPWMVREGLGLRVPIYTNNDVYSRLKREGATGFRWRVWAVDSRSVEGIKSDWCALGFSGRPE